MMENRRAFLKQSLLRIIGVALALTFGSSPVRAHPKDPPFARYLQEPKYVALLNELSKKHGFRKKDLERLFHQVQLKPELLKRFEHPRESLPYPQYRRLFITPEVITQGQQYFHRHRGLFQTVELTYGVDSAVIAAILGVESKFGTQPDVGYRVFDALNTIFAVIPRRAAFARKELIEFLLLCREEKLSPLTVKGSYSGAMGMPQFIPSSYRHYAIDYDRDGKKDLWRSHTDILASVANFLKTHGWQKGAPILLPVMADSSHPVVRELLDRGMRGRTTVRDLLGMGIAWADEMTMPDEGQEVSLLAYPWEDGERAVALFPNFQVLLRYNRSINYALVVADLTEMLVNESG
jgi:membrane-bound lytic murein transglycosylase B